MIGLFTIFVTNTAHACTNPTGVEGEIIYNDSYNVPQYCDATDWIAMKGGKGEYIPNAVYFDGTNDYLQNGSTLSNSKQLTASFWLKYEGGSTYFFSTQAPGVSGLSFRRVNSNKNLEILGANNSNTSIVSIESNSNTVLDSEWTHVLISFDLSDPAKRHLYINGVNEFASASIYLDDTLELDAQIYIGSLNSISKAQVELADFWIMDGYIDLSVDANLRKFIDVGGNPVYLGENGELPTGTSPDVFLSGDTDTWHTNKGTGGGLTENGALSTALTTPYHMRTEVVPSGLIRHWRLDETDGTDVYDTSGNANHATMVGGLSAATDSVSGVVGVLWRLDLSAA